MRASVAFSFGPHDEWNIVRAINESRRASKDYGLARQLGVFFDGRAVASARTRAGTGGTAREVGGYANKLLDLPLGQ